MQIQQRSNACIAKIIALVEVLVFVLGCIAVQLYEIPIGIALPAITLSPPDWLAVGIVIAIIVLLIGLGMNAKRREDENR